MGDCSRKKIVVFQSKGTVNFKLGGMLYNPESELGSNVQGSAWNTSEYHRHLVNCGESLGVNPGCKSRRYSQPVSCLPTNASMLWKITANQLGEKAVIPGHTPENLENRSKLIFCIFDLTHLLQQKSKITPKTLSERLH